MARVIWAVYLSTTVALDAVVRKEAHTAEVLLTEQAEAMESIKKSIPKIWKHLLEPGYNENVTLMGSVFNKLTMDRGEKLGSGAFGAVVTLQLKGDSNKKVAMKAQVKTTDSNYMGQNDEAIVGMTFGNRKSKRWSPYFISTYGVYTGRKVGFRMIMELADGDATSIFPIKIGQVAVVAHDVLMALRQLHEAGIAHRDVKEVNVFFVKQESERFSRAKLGDLGIACADETMYYDKEGLALGLNATLSTPEGTIPVISKCASLAGTSGYIPLEMEREGGARVGQYRKQDMWATAVMLGNMIGYRCARHKRFYPKPEDWEKYTPNAMREERSGCGWPAAGSEAAQKSMRFRTKSQLKLWLALLEALYKAETAADPSVWQALEAILAANDLDMAELDSQAKAKLEVLDDATQTEMRLTSLWPRASLIINPDQPNKFRQADHDMGDKHCGQKYYPFWTCTVEDHYKGYEQRQPCSVEGKMVWPDGKRAEVFAD